MLRTLSLLALTACAPATINLVQPGAVAKSTFDGEWYWLDTVVDVPYGTGVAFSGLQGELDRIRWEVEQDLLVGYRTWDHVARSDPDDTAAAPVVAYRILSHFDIRRAYNPTTGEESNVIQENTEAPWFDRAYMRVDWSTNLAAAGRWDVAGVSLAISAITDTDPADALTPRLDDSDGDGIIDHLRFPRRVLAQPDQVAYEGYGNVPTCLFFGRRTYDCAPAQIRVDSVFRRVDPDEDYLGAVWDPAWSSTFGLFTTERMHYDRQYGVTETERIRWANRHDLWDGEIARDAAGRPVCEAGGKRRPCADLSLADRPVPVPARIGDRELQPVVYHISNGFDERLISTLARVEAEWNAPLRDAVNGARVWACLDAGRDAEACEAKRDPALQAFVLCPHNPSRPGDPAVCDTDHTGPDGRPDGIPDVVEPGDLRYNLLRWIDQPQLDSPLGYGPSAADPVGDTVQVADGAIEIGAGRIIAATANLYGFGVDALAARTRDLVLLLRGELSEEAFVAGEDVRAWAAAIRDEGTSAELVGHVGVPEAEGPTGRSMTGSTRARADLATMDGRQTAATWAELSRLGRPTDPAAFRAWWAEVQGVLDRAPALAPAGPGAPGSWEALTASPFDDALWSMESAAALRAPDGAGASPLAPMDPTLTDQWEDGLRAAGRHAVDLDAGAYTNATLLGLARRLAEEGLDGDALYQRLREEIFVAVTLHEIGHTLGLRHNFAASTDAWNYHPEYWRLRDDGAMGPRHVDPETPAEIDGGIREYAYSSIMDYHASIAGDWHGLGRYDHAAIKLAYGGLVEVMTEVRPGQALTGWENRDAVGLLSYFAEYANYPAPILGTADDGLLDVHYTDYPRIADLQARVDVPLSRMTPLLPPEPGFTAGFDAFLVVGDGVPGVVEAGAPAAPFRFCTDELQGSGMCALWDEGSDPYEITRNLMLDHWDRYVTDYFARDRVGFGWGNHAAAVDARTFRPLQRWLRTYALFYTVFGGAFDAEAQRWLAADRGLGGWTVASADTLRFLSQVITRPEPGGFGRSERPDGLSLLRPGGDALTLPLGAGAFYDSTWDDRGADWFERYTRIGTYWDRMVALRTLTLLDPYDFVGFDTASDPRSYALGPATLWREPLVRFLGSLVADDPAAMAPVSLGDGALRYPDVARAEAWPPAGFEDALVEPASYWLVRYGAGTMASALLREGWDRTWLDRARLYAEGSDDGVTPPAGTATVRFTDPASGVTWVAWRYPDDQGRESGPAARLLDLATTLAVRCATLDDPLARQAACAERDRVASDIALQAEIGAWFRQGL